jgi:hypothetical protein
MLPTRESAIAFEVCVKDERWVDWRLGMRPDFAFGRRNTFAEIGENAGIFGEKRSFFAIKPAKSTFYCH